MEIWCYYAPCCIRNILSSSKRSFLNDNPSIAKERVSARAWKETAISRCKSLPMRRWFFHATYLTEFHPRVARLGNATGGSLQVLDLDTLAVTADVRTNYTVWTADMFPCGTKASIGTHTRAGVVNLQTGQRSWIYHCPHDVLSQKTDSTGNIVVCGFRNGCILSLDIRERRFWKMDSRNSIRMKSSVSSDMSDSIRLWDRRLVGRGWLRSFEGHKNSFSSLQLGIDPTGTVLMSGCEDNAVRIWSLRTGSLLHTETGISCTPAKLVFRASLAAARRLRKFMPTTTALALNRAWNRNSK
ncbi:hypothetical protein SELMODRAFT_422538 [Selaginella moellendorffii]|uniref:Uncharacterized protein n=1 Tax=Selaginella moellendorffii TaxID=88036 RepID=D8SIR8_SELML|nr:hypothetical protein SELMODRAFT_422538 [Selaginella moellendorffii]